MSFHKQLRFLAVLNGESPASGDEIAGLLLADLAARARASNASDLHLANNKKRKAYQIRFRVDGRMHPPFQEPLLAPSSLYAFLEGFASPTLPPLGAATSPRSVHFRLPLFEARVVRETDHAGWEHFVFRLLCGRPFAGVLSPAAQDQLAALRRDARP